MSIRYVEAHRLDQCTCCGQELSGRIRMLELDQRDGTYHDREDVPEDRSQGWFAFGLRCAKRVVADGGKLPKPKTRRLK